MYMYVGMYTHTHARDSQILLHNNDCSSYFHYLRQNYVYNSKLFAKVEKTCSYQSDLQCFALVLPPVLKSLNS